MLTVYIDFKDPASYLAFRPILSLATRLGTHVQWRPFRSRQALVPEKKDTETKGDTHRRVRAGQRRETHLRYAKVQGLNMTFRDRPAETDAALVALLCDLAHPADYIRHTFNAYWTSDADLNDMKLIEAYLETTGNGAAIASYLIKCADTFDAYQNQIEEDGVFFTPTFLVCDEIFVGREHLPLIEKIITDRQS